MLLSALKGRDFENLVICYDIACQHRPNFAKRNSRYAEDLQLALSRVKTTHIIPMFHLPGHGEKCHARYSPYTTQHVGRTDGENIERGWAHINPVALSTREMTKAARHETLNDHFGNFNWDRVTALGKGLRVVIVHRKQNEYRAYFKK